MPPPSEEVLKEIPGALEAWKGLSALDLKVCVVRGPKIIISPEKLATFQHAPLSISEEVRALEVKHKDFEDILSFMALPAGPGTEPETDPRGGPNGIGPDTESHVTPTMESLAALEAHAPGLVEHQAAGDKHVTMLKDDKRQEVWLLSKNGDHTLPKGTLLGGFGSGQLMPRKPERNDCVPWCLVDGDKSYVQLASAEDGDTKKKPKAGTFYTVARPLEKSASQKASPLTLTSYGKVEPNGTAGKHGYTFEFPEDHPKHSPLDYFLSKAKLGTHTTASGNYFSSLVARAGWSGSVGVMWRLQHDPVRHCLHARKPVAIAMDNISLKKGIPMKVLWMQGSKVDLPKPAEDPKPQGSDAEVPAAA